MFESPAHHPQQRYPLIPRPLQDQIDLYLDANFIFMILCVVHLSIALPVFFGFVSLVSFHTYLNWLGMGTYDWMARNEQERRNKKKKKMEVQNAAAGEQRVMEMSPAGERAATATV